MFKNKKYIKKFFLRNKIIFFRRRKVLSKTLLVVTNLFTQDVPKLLKISKNNLTNKKIVLRLVINFLHGHLTNSELIAKILTLYKISI